jgi:hypothetical protein
MILNPVVRRPESSQQTRGCYFAAAASAPGFAGGVFAAAAAICFGFQKSGSPLMKSSGG